MRRSDIGVLQVNAKADIVVLNGDSPNMLGWSDPVAAVMLHANPGDVEHVLVDGRFRKRDFELVNENISWAEARSRFLQVARRIQPQFVTPPSLPEKLGGVGEFGDVETAITIRRSEIDLCFWKRRQLSSSRVSGAKLWGFHGEKVNTDVSVGFNTHK